MIDSISGQQIQGRLTNITSDYAQATDGCDMVLITQPSFMLTDTLKRLTRCLKRPTIIGIVPGTGGAEYMARGLLQEGHILFGVDRVPCIARIAEYGKTVKASYKKSVRICALPSDRTEQVRSLFSSLFPVECISLENYLTITLTPSNPILHTARLFALAHSRASAVWTVPPLFYREWDDTASELLLRCDEELQKLCGVLSELSINVISLRVHYESDTAEDMTKKLRSLPALKDILCPMLYMNDGYVLDLTSRYFTEDFPYGLCILKGFAEVCKISVPNMDLILRWYERIARVQYFIGDNFCGPDLKNTGIPQNYGIHTIRDIYRFYLGAGE